MKNINNPFFFNTKHTYYFRIFGQFRTGSVDGNTVLGRFAFLIHKFSTRSATAILFLRRYAIAQQEGPHFKENQNKKSNNNLDSTTPLSLSTPPLTINSPEVERPSPQTYLYF